MLNKILILLAATSAGIAAEYNYSAKAQTAFAPPPRECIAIKNDSARLNCIQSLIYTEGSAPPHATDSWPIIRSSDANGAKSIVSIARSADLAASDPDLAGLMIRCAPSDRFDVLVALVTPVPIRAKRVVSLQTPSMNLNFDAESVLPGSLLLLPPMAATLLASWDNVERLSITIGGGGETIKGQITIVGLAGARQRLSVACSTQEK